MGHKSCLIKLQWLRTQTVESFSLWIEWICMRRRGWGKLGPLSLGLTVPLLMWAVGPISSLSINPARAFGTAVVTG